MLKSAADGEFVSYTYNVDGSVATAARGNSSGTTSLTSYSYDPATGRVTTVAGPTGQISYKYDNAGNKIETDTPAASTLLAYDADNRLLTVSHPGNELVASYTYDKVGNRSALSRGDGVVTTYKFDALNRLTDLVNSSGPSFHYSLRSDGKTTGITETGKLTPGTTTYQYDLDGRLTNETEQLASGATLINNRPK